MTNQTSTADSPFPPRTTTPSHDLIPSDGFSTSELSSTAQPHPWTPLQHYESVAIASLVPSPRPVTFTGRVANVFTFRTGSTNPRAPRGCWRIVVRDERGTVMVRLCLDFCVGAVLLTAVCR